MRTWQQTPVHPSEIFIKEVVPSLKELVGGDIRWPLSILATPSWPCADTSHAPNSNRL